MKICDRAAALVWAAAFLGICVGHTNERKQSANAYRVLNPLIENNLMIFPVVTNAIHDTHMFLTLDEGIRSGQVVVSEEGSGGGMVRRPLRDFTHPRVGPQVNSLTLSNNSDRPLLLLAGEIVTGGKQDRVVGQDRIIDAKSGPIDLGVFCVEPHRWTGASSQFGALGFLMAQPSVRSKAMADQNQSAVWDEVAKSRTAVAQLAPAPTVAALSGTSSYAATMQNRFVQDQVNSLAAPVERSYDKLLGELRAQHAVGAVVSINGQLVWADTFASAALFQTYWPKLVRSYAAEAFEEGAVAAKILNPPSIAAAQAFLENMNAKSETADSEPNVYRTTELVGGDFKAFILTSLLPGTGFDVHIAKMKD